MSWVRRSLSDSSTSQNKAEATEQTKHQQNQVSYEQANVGKILLKNRK